MRASIGGLSVMNIFIVFFIIALFLITGTLMYYKGYKVNSSIISALEMYEGYNEYSAAEINRLLTNVGYRQDRKINDNCGSGLACIKVDENDKSMFDYKLSCSHDVGANGKENGYVTYEVKTYIYIDLPLGFGTMKLPVKTRTNPIYHFSGSTTAGGCY